MSSTSFSTATPASTTRWPSPSRSGTRSSSLRGITTVAGNVGLAQDHGERASGLVVRRRRRVPVTAGCPAPLLRPALDAGHVHGDTGLGGRCCRRRPARPWPDTPSTSSSNRSAPRPGEITLVATGPLTNIGLALRREPRLAQLGQGLRDHGRFGRRAATSRPRPSSTSGPTPRRRRSSSHAGWTVRMIGLDVTLQARATAAVQDRMRGLGELGPRTAAAGPRRSTATRPRSATAGARRVRGRLHRRSPPRSSPTRLRRLRWRRTARSPRG